MTKTLETYIAEQPRVLRHLISSTASVRHIAERLIANPITKVWFAGSGTSLYAGAIAATLWEQLLGIDSEAISSLELLNDLDDRLLGQGSVVIAISQSGSTKVLAEGLQRARRLGSQTVAVTSDDQSLLAKAAAHVLNSETGEEDVFAKTKGFTTTALTACLLGISLAKASTSNGAYLDSHIDESVESLPELVQQTIDATRTQLSHLTQKLQDVESLFVVGAGAQLPAAHEGALKLLEVAKLPVGSRELEESFHGYFNAFGPRVGLILLAGPIAQKEKLQAFQRAAAQIAAPLITIADDALVGNILESGSVDLRIPHMPYQPLSPILGVIPLQMLSYTLANTRDVDANHTRYPELYQVFRTKTIHE